jgi:hypothetical protein
MEDGTVLDDRRFASSDTTLLFSVSIFVESQPTRTFEHQIDSY